MYKVNKEQASQIQYYLEVMHPDAQCELEYDTPFKLLVAVVLSAQCTDKRVNQITKKLFEVYSTPYDFENLTLDELKPYIYSCGFFNNKGKNIIALSKMLVEKYDGIVPKTLEELITLPGVGRKTASVVLNVAYNIPAMPVDTHVFRVSRRLGLSDGKTPKDVEKDLKSIYNEEDWNNIHHGLIFHGRYICHARNPECDRCMLTHCCKEYKERKSV